MSPRSLRSNQIITTFGIGQIVNFPGEQSLMIGGLNLWEESLNYRKNQGEEIDIKEFIIHERRLQKLLKLKYFLHPFPYKTTGNVNKRITVPALRFPRWYHCTNVKCGFMREIPLTQPENPYCPKCKYKMIPVRFIAACPKGHIQDVPFREWVHDGPVPDDESDHELIYSAGSGSGDLSSIRIRCSCGESRSLAGIMNVSRSPEGEIYNSALASIGLQEDLKSSINENNPNNNNPNGQYCKGSRPWLGPDHLEEECGEHLQVLIRGASNVHYAMILSSIHIPEVTHKKKKIIDQIINQLTIEKLCDYYYQNSDHNLLKIVLQARQEIIDGIVELDEVFNEIEKRIIENQQTSKKSENMKPDDLKSQEYRIFQKEHDDENTSLKTRIIPLNQYDDAEFIKKYFDMIVLLEKLQETRVFTGFSRIEPRFDANTNDLSVKKIDWLPAIQVSGEGILLVFKKEAISEWLEQFSGTSYDLIKRFVKSNSKLLLRINTLDPAFVMIHTFAHLLIKRLVFNSGYSSAALRERIYYDRDKDMHGVLIYTASGDSEGSLGGLVKQGKEKYMGKIIREAIADAEWCSVDPICMDIGISSGQGPDNVNGAACHNCCLLPETSCEWFNVLLDRSLIIGSFNNEITGYFK